MFKFLLITQLIEVPMFLALARQHRTLYGAAIMLLINCFTWPIATMLFWYSGLTIWSIETIVILMETVLFMVVFGYTFLRSLAFAFIINAVSTAAGFLFPGLYAGRL